MRGERPRGNRDPRLHPRVVLIYRASLPDADGSDFHDLRTLHILVGCLEIHDGEVEEGVDEVARPDELCGLEKPERKSERWEVVWSDS